MDERDLSIFQVAGRISEGEEDATGRPREFISKRVIRVFGGRQPAAIGDERDDFAAFGVDCIDNFDSV